MKTKRYARIRKRKCGECKRQFGSPEALLKHRYIFGTCRSDVALLAAGFYEKPAGVWWMRKQEINHE